MKSNLVFYNIINAMITFKYLLNWTWNQTSTVAIVMLYTYLPYINSATLRIHYTCNIHAVLG